MAPGVTIRRMRLLLLACALVLPAIEIHAQERAPFAPQLELRPGVTLTPRTIASIGLGLNVRAGWYARAGVALTAPLDRDAPWRAELTSRFLFDPYAERRLGLYGGAGVGLAARAGGSSRGELLLLVGAEGHAAGRFVPAFEVTLGGGVRVALVLRTRRAIGR